MVSDINDRFGEVIRPFPHLEMEDYAMEIDKEAKCLRQAEKYLKADDDRRFLDGFSKTIIRSKTTDKLQTRLENAIEDAKMLQQYHYYK